MYPQFRVGALMRSAGLRWLVLAALVLGMLVSAVGTLSSHGLAALAAVDHGAAGMTDTARAHSHEVDDSGGAGVADAGHPHHADDHSHDKAHTPPRAGLALTPRSPRWQAVVRYERERVAVFRLDRPPRIQAPA